MDVKIDERGLLKEPCSSCNKAYVVGTYCEWRCDEEECPYKEQSEDKE